MPGAPSFPGECCRDDGPVVSSEPEAKPPGGVGSSMLPGLTVLRTYRAGWLPRDLVAGLVLTALLVPQGMAYAELAGLPPVTGLYTSILCLLCLLYTSPSPRDLSTSRMPSSA